MSSRPPAAARDAESSPTRLLLRPAGHRGKARLGHGFQPNPPPDTHGALSDALAGRFQPAAALPTSQSSPRADTNLHELTNKQTNKQTRHRSVEKPRKPLRFQSSGEAGRFGDARVGR